MDENIDRAHIAWPIVDGKDHQAPSVFRPEVLLREARKQRSPSPKFAYWIRMAMSSATSNGPARGRMWKRSSARMRASRSTEEQHGQRMRPIARPRRRSSGRANWAHSPSPDLWKTQITKEHCKVGAALLPPASSRLLTKSDGF